MIRMIGIGTIAIMLVTQAGLMVKGGDISTIRAGAFEIGKEFSLVALETLKEYSVDPSKAESEYKKLDKSQVLLSASDKEYRELGANAAFGAEMAYHIMWGGASYNRTRSTMRKLAVTYGKGLVLILKGKPVSAASQLFMMDLSHFLTPRRLELNEYRLAVRSAKGQYSALYKIFRK